MNAPARSALLAAITLALLGGVVVGCTPEDEASAQPAPRAGDSGTTTAAGGGDEGEPATGGGDGDDPGDAAAGDDKIDYDTTAARKGKSLWMRFQCAQCHRVNGNGGTNGPDLSKVAVKYTKLKGGAEKARAWFDDHLEDPEKFPGTDAANYFVKMPKFPLDEKQRAQLVELLMSFQGPDEK